MYKRQEQNLYDYYGQLEDFKKWALFRDFGLKWRELPGTEKMGMQEILDHVWAIRSELPDKFALLGASIGDPTKAVEVGNHAVLFRQNPMDFYDPMTRSTHKSVLTGAPTLLNDDTKLPAGTMPYFVLWADKLR